MVKIFSKKDNVADIYEILEDEGIVIVDDNMLGKKVIELKEYIDDEEDFNDDLYSARLIHNDEEITYLYLGNKVKTSVAKKLITMTFEEEAAEEESEDS